MGSIDFPELFSQPDRWATAREAVDVFAFSANAVSGDPFDIGGDNVLDTFVAVDAFASLHEWDIPIAIEGGAIKFFACDHASWAEYAIRGIDNVEAHGGRVSFFTMDEPLLGGQLLENGMACGYSIEETAVEVAEFVADVTAAHPAVRVGVVEPYPHISADELLAWLSALSDAGAAPAFFHLDVDMERVAVENHDVAGDLARLAAGSAAAGIPFGVILTSNWTQAGTDPGYVASTLEWAEVVRGAIGRPTHVVVQSWQGPAASGLHEVPINLPDEAGAVSHTRLLLDLLALFESDT